MLIPISILKPLCKIVAKESTRYAINGVQFLRKGSECTAVTTDGKRLLVCTWTDSKHGSEYPDIGQPKEQSDFSVLLTCSAVLEAEKLVVKRGSREILKTWIHLFEKDGVWTFGCTDLEHPRYLPCSPIEGHFPDYTQVVPDPADMCPVGSGVGVNTKLFSELMTSVSLCVAKDKPIMLLRTGAANNPLRLDATGEIVTALGVLMPVNLG